MTDTLYQDRILELAKAGRALPRLEGPDATARFDNPICGDRVTMDFKFDGGRIVAVGAKVQGCALCQAAAAVIASNATGKTSEDVTAAGTAITAFLAGEGEDLPWPDLGTFEPVRPMKSRRECVTLPFKAAEKAFLAS
jgi:nitrogen fixation NifU-like protein